MKRFLLDVALVAVALAAILAAILLTGHIPPGG